MKTISEKRAEKIARNINAMDTTYQYSDDMRDYRFWTDLEDKLRTILHSLSDEDRSYIATLCDTTEAQYFGLI